MLRKAVCWIWVHGSTGSSDPFVRFFILLIKLFSYIKNQHKQNNKGGMFEREIFIICALRIS